MRKLLWALYVGWVPLQSTDLKRVPIEVGCHVTQWWILLVNYYELLFYVYISLLLYFLQVTTYMIRWCCIGYSSTLYSHKWTV
jgi:hypothetical protein